MHLRTERVDDFPFDVHQFWRRVGTVDQYQQWWPWLRHFDGNAMRDGEVWECSVQPPVPYAVRFSITLHDIVGERSVSATITGDIVGTASLTVQHTPTGCRSTLISDLEPDKQSLRIMSLAARPVVRFGHNWVLDVGVRQFIAKSGG
jgi:hypothetical protein